MSREGFELTAYIDKQRRTGRTTRMLDFAAERARSGEYVAVIFDNHFLVKEAFSYLLSKQLAGATYVPSHTIDFPEGIINLLTSKAFDYERWTVPGRRNEHVLVDHHAIENHFREVFQEYHRWDTNE